MTTNNMTPQERGSLGQYLWDLRQAKKLTLRQVEDSAESVSNGYLSQLETGQNRKPSPHVLHQLADLYGGSFEKMMELAGHITPAQRNAAKSRRSTRLPTFAKEELSQEEEEELLKYLAFIRMRKGKT